MAEAKIWKVGELNTYVRRLFFSDSKLRDISIQGELSNVKKYTSGHLYFTLKDKNACISGVMFDFDLNNEEKNLKAGDEVIVQGNVTLYEKSGSYQINAQSIKKAGVGELFRKIEELKQELRDMGMFDEMYKKPIPAYIKRLGVVTASTGAAVRDIINVSKRRNPYIEIILYPARVQGDGAAESVSRGIEVLDTMNVDTIIVGRGGGSIEDLMAFNDRRVAEAIFKCGTPIISGTGHETDFTIADMVADLRAPTPSAAAELAVFDHSAFIEELKTYRERLFHGVRVKLSRYREKVSGYRARLEARSPVSRLRVKKERVRGYGIRLKNEMERILSEKRKEMAVYAETLEALSPLNTLSRGYTFTETEKGLPVKSIKDVNEGEKLKIYTRDGRIYANVENLEENT